MKRLQLFASFLTFAALALPVAFARAEVSPAVCPNQSVREFQPRAFVLGDCRAYEQVSPAEQGGQDAKGFPGVVRVSADGDQVRYVSLAPFPGACGERFGSWYLSSRVGEAWSTEGLLPCVGELSGVVGASEDLSLSIIWIEGAALTPTGSAEYTGWYLRSASGAYRLLASADGSIGGGGGNPLFFALVGFSHDDSHMAFESSEDLAGGAHASVPNVYELNLAQPESAPPSLVGQVPPAGDESCGPEGPACEVSTGGSLGGEGAFAPGGLPAEGRHYTQSAISTDGSRVFFLALPSERLYVRENEETTLAVSEGKAHFWGASPSGDYVFYSEGEERPVGEELRWGRLYRYDVETKQREALMAPTSGLLGVLGFSSDANTVYFAATDALADAGNENAYGEHAREERHIANLYEWRMPEGGTPTTTFIATLDDETVGGASDVQDWADRLEGSTFPYEFKTSQVTGDGQTLLFWAHLPLDPGYDNNENGELYRYRATPEGGVGSLTCVSCDPDGATAKASALLAGHPNGATPTGTETALPARVLSENGNRVFFETADPLVSADTSTSYQVYEWEAEGEGTCHASTEDDGCIYLISSGTGSEESYILGASANGNDVFFFTREQLTDPELEPNNVHLYDACVDCTGKSPPKCETGTVLNPGSQQCEQEPCEDAETCKGPPSQPPAESFPATSVFSGPGNLVAPPPVVEKPPGKPKPKSAAQIRAERLAKALKACRKKRSRTSRRACEKQARRSYGAKPKKSKKKAKG